MDANQPILKPCKHMFAGECDYKLSRRQGTNDPSSTMFPSKQLHAVWTEADHLMAVFSSSNWM
eukprot:1160882-Pelagomonas_calceolata.AAC.2